MVSEVVDKNSALEIQSQNLFDQADGGENEWFYTRRF